MRVLLAASLAAAISWFSNKKALHLNDTRVIIYLVPMIEEVSKSLLALLLNAPLILSHLTFGMIEAIADQINSRNGLIAGMVSILGHTLFGFVTYTTFFYLHNIFIGILGGYILHTLWNLFVMEFIVSRKRRKSS